MFDFRIHVTLKTKTNNLTFNEQLNLSQNTCPQSFFRSFPTLRAWPLTQKPSKVCFQIKSVLEVDSHVFSTF